jgi:hypothetical protein
MVSRRSSPVLLRDAKPAILWLRELRVAELGQHAVEPHQSGKGVDSAASTRIRSQLRIADLVRRRANDKLPRQAQQLQPRSKLVENVRHYRKA